MNLFDISTGCQNQTTGRGEIVDCARAATMTEVEAYLEWLAARDGVALLHDDARNVSGIWRGRGADAVCIVPMPGYGEQPRATIEYLDDAGNVVRTMPLAENAKGGIALTAKQVADATGLKPVRKVKAKAAAKPVERAAAVSAPIAPATVESAPVPAPAAPAMPTAADAALLARVVMLETALRSLGLAPARGRGVVANDNAAGRVRSETERRAIVRAWRMRCEARQRADLDRRALEAGNVWARAESARADLMAEQAANARTAATAYKREMEAACERVTMLEQAEAFLIQRGDEMRDARDAATALYRREEQKAAGAVLHAWKLRGRLQAAHKLADTMAEQASAADARADRAEQEAARLRPMERLVYDAEERAHNAGERAARMVRAAAGYRITGRRAAQDVRSARAEARALSKRLADARASIAAVTPPAPPSGSVMANAFAGAR